MKITRFKDIPQFPNIHYSIDVGLDNLPEWIEKETNPSGNMSPLQLCPDFQRGHVWTKEQQISFMEYFLSGGTPHSQQEIERVKQLRDNLTKE